AVIPAHPALFAAASLGSRSAAFAAFTAFATGTFLLLGLGALLAWWLGIARREESFGAAGTALAAFATLTALASCAALSDGQRHRTLAVALRWTGILRQRRYGRPGERDSTDSEPELGLECHDVPPHQKCASLKRYSCMS